MENNIMNNTTVTTDETANDIAYHRAQEILKNMLDLKLISLSEFNKITKVNRQTFSPIYADVMPKIT